MDWYQSFRSLNEGGTGSEEEPTSAQEERADGGGGGDQDDPGEEHQVSDQEPDYSIESIDSIESQQVSGQDDDHDTGQHVSDQDNEQDEGAGQNVVSSSSLRKREAALKSIFEELRESNNSTEKGEKNKMSSICGAPTVHRSVRPKAAT